MGSGAGAAREAVDALVEDGERVGLVTVRLYRPFPAEQFVAALPPSVRSVAVLDRTKEPGSVGEPLVPRRPRRRGRGHGRRRAPLHQGASGHRRPIRVVVQGVHAGDGEGRPRRARLRPAQAPFHRRHLRRRDIAQPALGPRVPSASACRRSPGRLLRPRVGRHGWGQQEQRQDHRRRHRRLRTGLLRVRLEEVGRHDRVAPALRARADKFHLPRQRRRLRRLPPLRLPGAGRRSWTWPRTGPPSCSTALMGPSKSGTGYPSTCKASCRTSTSSSGSSTATGWQPRLSSATGSTP